MNSDYIRKCKRKKIFYDELDAKLAGLRMSLIHKTNLSNYVCKYCGNWHIGRSDKINFYGGLK